MFPMRCYSCTFEAEGDICPNCGAPLKTYRHIINLSAAYYNDALDRARSRDMDGAIKALKMCLRLDRSNISARNLLGLLYYEIGEPVQSITQWVVSNNLQPEGNPVERYLEELRRSPDTLDTMNKAIRKYNAALRCARRGSVDVAIIHLKKALQLNPRLLKARELLALLFMQRTDYARARFELAQCAKIDIASDKAIRYLSEIERVASMKNAAREEKQNSRKKGDAVVTRSGNDTVIQPTHRFGTGGALSLVSVFFGLALGAAAAAFLLLPAAQRRAGAESDRRIAAISEEMDSKTARIAEYERELAAVEQRETQLQYRLDAFEGKESASSAMEGLMQAASAYLAGETDVATLAGFLEVINAEEVNASPIAGYKELFDAVVAGVGPEVSDYFFERGANAVRNNDYPQAVRMYGLAAQYDPENAETFYNYAESVRLSGDTDTAKLLYDDLINRFPGSRRASDAAARIAELNT